MASNASAAVAQLASNLDSLNSRELKELRVSVTTMIDGRIRDAEAREVSQARDEIKAIANRLGMPLSEIFKTSGRTGQLPAKYQNPSNPQEVWTGRGRQPKWVKDMLDDGKTLAQLEVKPS